MTAKFDGSKSSLFAPVPSQDAPAQLSKFSKLPSWYAAYVALAVLNLLVVSLSLGLNYRQANLQTESAETYRIYADLLESVSTVGRSAIEANLPATTIFSSHDVAAESARMNRALQQFRESFAALRTEVATKASATAQHDISEEFPAVLLELDAMQLETQQALAAFSKGQLEIAGQHTAAKTEHFVSMLGHLMGTTAAIRRTQADLLAQERLIAHGTNRFGIALVLGSVLVTFAVFVHAGRVRRTTKSQREQRERMMRALALARDQAEHAASVKAQFLANMSHEIRTPMNGVLGMLDALAETPLSDKQAKMLKTANTSADLLLSIIDDVLDVSKIEAGLLLIESRPVNISQIIQHVHSLYNVRAVEKMLTLNCKLPPLSLPQFLSDPTRLTQLLSNLVSNAIKFTKSGEVVITAELLDENADTMRIRFSVRDTGMGIPAETQERLFAPFMQADSSTSRRFGGTGLGLAICKQLVMMLDKECGEIGVESTPGNGATFYFVLRLTKADETASHPDISTGVYGTAAITSRFSAYVLIAEDNETNQHVAVTLLESLGLRTKLAANGREAIEAAQHEHFDLILMDYHMPEVDGCDATIGVRRFEQQQNKTPTPIIAVTASALNEDKERCLAAGMDDFLAKPIRQRTLVTILEKWLPLDTRYEITEAVDETANQGKSPDDKQIAIWANLPRDLFDLEQITEMHALAGDTFGELIEQFHRSTIDGLAAMRNAVECSDPLELKRAAHKLKGAAATLGAKTLADHCCALETMGKEQRMDGALERLQNLEQNYLEVRRHMRFCAEHIVASAA